MTLENLFQGISEVASLQKRHDDVTAKRRRRNAITAKAQATRQENKRAAEIAASRERSARRFANIARRKIANGRAALQLHRVRCASGDFQNVTREDGEPLWVVAYNPMTRCLVVREDRIENGDVTTTTFVYLAKCRAAHDAAVWVCDLLASF